MKAKIVLLAVLTLGLASQPARAQTGTGSASTKPGATLSAPVAIAIPGPMECVIPSGTATQTVSDPYALSTTEIHFTDSHTGAGQSHWNPLTVKAPYVHSVSCYKGVFVNMKDLPRGLTCTMSTMNPAAPPNTGNAVKVLNCK
ncbi:hypothetical protein EBR44_07375 [bacterium]|jgi:hypothetical protein|nr:hypothetical protein [bacterium]